MKLTLKSEEKGDGIFSVNLVTPEETVLLGDYAKSSTGDISNCYGWSMTPFVAKLIGIEPVKLLQLVDKGDVIVDVSVKN